LNIVAILTTAYQKVLFIGIIDWQSAKEEKIMDRNRFVRLIAEAQQRGVALRIYLRSGQTIFFSTMKKDSPNQKQIEVCQNGNLIFISEDRNCFTYSHTDEISSIQSSREGYGAHTLDPDLENTLNTK
jgi:hypothetical protein